MLRERYDTERGPENLGAPGSLSQETPVALRWLVVELLHFNGDGLGSRNEFVVFPSLGDVIIIFDPSSIG